MYTYAHASCVHLSEHVICLANKRTADGVGPMQNIHPSQPSTSTSTASLDLVTPASLDPLVLDSAHAPSPRPTVKHVVLRGGGLLSPRAGQHLSRVCGDLETSELPASWSKCPSWGIVWSSQRNTFVSVSGCLILLFPHYLRQKQD